MQHDTRLPSSPRCDVLRLHLWRRGTRHSLHLAVGLLGLLGLFGLPVRSAGASPRPTHTLEHHAKGPCENYLPSAGWMV